MTPPLAPAVAPKREFLRFVAVGPVGLALGAAQFELLWRFLPAGAGRETSAWFLSSVIGIAWVHALHVRFTFRERSGRWLATLPAAYVLYVGSTVIGTGVMHLTTQVLHVPRWPAWCVACAASSGFNFLALQRVLSRRERT